MTKQQSGLEKSLPNDDCPDTQQRELAFLQSQKLEQHTFRDNAYCCVLYSRVARTHYEWPRDRPLDIEELQRAFGETGHTLGIDYTRTYARKLAFDLDCICRARPGSVAHLTSELAANVMVETRRLVQELLGVSDVPSVLWNNKCGFHLYCDINVSLPTHLLLMRALWSKFAHQDVVIEVPTIMPLPYSAKIPYEPYKPLLPSQERFNLAINYTKEPFHEIFEYSSLFAESTSIAHIRTKSSDLYLNKTRSVLSRYCVPKFTNASSVRIFPQHDFMHQFADYMQHVVLFDESATHFGTLDLSKIESEKTRGRILEFMALVNKLFDDANSTDCGIFVKLSLLDHGGLYLQPYVVTLHKFLLPIDDETFSLVLRAVYRQQLQDGDACIERFIRYYDKNTLKCYNDTYEFMLEHLRYLYVNAISPCATLEEQIDSLLRQRTNQESYITFRKSLQAMPKPQQKEVIMSVVEMYVDTLIQLQIIMYNTSTSNYYILDNGTHYRMSSKIDKLPSVIYNWVGSGKRITEDINACLDMYRPQYVVSQAALLSSCRFQFSTTVGVFNSLIGLYTAKTRFLRFLCYRDFAVWPHNRSYDMYEQQNYDLLKHMQIAEHYARIMTYNITDLFVHFLLAPAMIQLKSIMFIEEFRIHKILNILGAHANLSSAFFLLDYFPLDPRFVYAIMYIYNRYDGFNSLETYAKMCDHIFNYNRVDEAAWRKHFEKALASLKYEKRDTQMETLLTISGDGVDGVTEEFCFYATILGVCMIKCPTYCAFVRAFEAECIPEGVDKPHPDYVDFTLDMGLESYRNNMRRAIRIVFGSDLSPEQQNLVTTIFSMGMSTSFIPETTNELTGSISALFVPVNVLKKIFLYHGLGGVGKSLICNIIQRMASPKVGRWNNLLQAMERANVTAKHNVTILNEVRYVEAEKIKTITGNDAESTKQFYSQEYEMHNSQSLIYGATNSIVEFKGQTDVDLVSVSRFHVIRLTGQQISADFKAGSLFAMLTNSQLYNGTIDATEYDLANGMSWLSYATYVLRRDKNFFPCINENNVHSKQYREDVYRKNNRLYNFLSSIGVVEEVGFSMSADVLLNLAKRNLDSKKGQKIENLADFKNRLETQYGIKLENGMILSNLQQVGLVEHIYINMAVMETSDSVITREDIEARVNMYSSFIDKDNARSYFQRENRAYYDFKSGCYRGIAFKQDGSTDYDGNDASDLFALQGNNGSSDPFEFDSAV